jgi:nucleoid-associated protein YgaU
MDARSPRRMDVPLLALVAAGGVALVFAIVFLHREPPAKTHAGSPPSSVSNPASATKSPGPAGPASSQAETASPPAPPKDIDIPTFDVARIEPTGEAVIAGRAAPGSTVELLGEGKVHGRAVATQSGEFVMASVQLPPGTYKLALRSTEADGKQLISQQTVPVSLKPSVGQQPSVALASPATPTPQQKATGGSSVDKAPSVALASPATPNLQQNATAASTAKAAILDAVKMEPPGELDVRGRAEPGATVQLYLNDSYVASATADAKQHFSFTIKEGITPGSYRVRADAVEPKSGAVREGSEVPFKVLGPVVASTATNDHAQAKQADVKQSQQPSVAAAPPAETGSPSEVVVPKVTTTTVVRGDSLWRISRSTYGEGHRYPRIFEANRNKIRDPNLIYPGQVFVLPKK